MESEIQKKKQYNELLKREKKAHLYLDNLNIDINKILNIYIPAYQEIVRELSKLLLEISHSREESLEGFNIKE